MTVSASMIKELPSNPFWDFSLRFYREKKVETALLELQQRYGFNVNVVLCFLWYGFIDQGGMTQKSVRKMLKNIAPWHNKVVLSLRRLRKQHQSRGELYRDILELELNAEHLEQILIYDHLWLMPKKPRAQSEKVANICRSISSYCYLMRVKADDEMINIVTVLMEVLLPSLDSEEIHTLIEQRLLNSARMSQVVGTQLWIDL